MFQTTSSSLTASEHPYKSLFQRHQLLSLKQQVHITYLVMLWCRDKLVFSTDKGMAMEEAKDWTAGFFTELNIHNQFDWVQNTT